MRTKPKITWIVLADGARAQVLSRIGRHGALEEVFSAESNMARAPTRKLGADRPGRAHNATGSGRFARENPADWHDQAAAEFATGVANRLNRAVRKDGPDALILVAAPKTLSVLRKTLSGTARELVEGEFAKDLTGIPSQDLEAHFQRLEI